MSEESPKHAGDPHADARLPEALCALLVALVFFALPVREALLDPSRVLFGVDTATVQLPWSAVIDADVSRPRNPALWDQGVGFYPFYRWVVESVARGESVQWNPLIFTGAPALANPQYGVLDPQVWLLALGWKLGGLDGFHWMLAVAAWLRFAAAGLGAYLLARRLRLSRIGAALTGATFGLSGYQVLWLNYGLGHVTPLLPWVLWGLEGVRGPRPLVGVAISALALCLAVLGGHPETAFFVGAAAGSWALGILVRERRVGALGLAGLALGSSLGAVALLSFKEYLDASQALAEREAVLGRDALDLVALGTLAALVGYVLVWRRGGDEPHGGHAGQRGGATRLAARAVGLLFAVGAGVWVLAARGLEPGSVLVLLHDFFGAPGDGTGGYRGPRVITEEGSGWVANVSLALAFASVLSPTGVLRRRGLVTVLGLLSLGLCLRVPGLHELYQRLPLVGLGETVRLGTVSALMLALLAGDGLASAGREARGVAAAAIALGIVVLLFGRGVEPLDRGGRRLGPEQDEHVGYLVLPDEVLANEAPYIEGWVSGLLAFENARLAVEPVEASGVPRSGATSRLPFELVDAISDRARAEASPDALARVPDGARFFRTQYLLVDRMAEGHWRLVLELYRSGADAQPMARRVVSTITIDRPPASRPLTLLLCGLGLVVVAFAPRASSVGPVAPVRLALALLAALQGLAFADGKNPSVPEAEVFPPTATGELLRAELGDYRYFAEPGVMPADTGMVLGVRGLDGYDGLHPYLYSALKNYALRPGVHQLLGWNARGVDLGGPVFRLFGVGALVLKSPLGGAAEADWELVASPAGARDGDDVGPRYAETWIYRPRAPLPRAFCVPEVVSLTDLSERLASWDPARTAALEDDWRPVQPFAHADVTELAFTNDTVSMRVRLDGDGLLVLTDGAFPGWVADVNGVRREVLTANLALRALPLGPGEHEVVFRYESEAVRAGRWISSVAALVWAAVLAAGALRRGAG